MVELLRELLLIREEVGGVQKLKPKQVQRQATMVLISASNGRNNQIFTSVDFRTCIGITGF